jgi:uncharacterized membrane protein YgaE (UPF0421/DUF939 family)
MKSIIANSIKITLAAVLAILCAQALKLDFAVSAGIVAILSVQPTKKETLRTALARLLAFVLALAISITLFNLLGFTVPVFFLYLLIFILVCQWRKWISAMAMDSVLISHFLSFGKTGTAEYTSNKNVTHSWFVGYAKDTTGRKLAIAVIMEGAGYGSKYAAPLAAKVFNAYFE